MTEVCVAIFNPEFEYRSKRGIVARDLLCDMLRNFFLLSRTARARQVRWACSMHWETVSWESDTLRFVLGLNILFR